MPTKINESLILHSWLCLKSHQWGRNRQEPSSQLITLENHIFLVKNSNLQSSSLRTRPGGVDCNGKLDIVKEHYRLGRCWDWVQKRNVI